MLSDLLAAAGDALEILVQVGLYIVRHAQAYGQLGGQPSLDYNYTVFGHVYEGLDIVKEIAAAKTDDHNRPKKDIQVYSITVSVYQTGE